MKNLYKYIKSEWEEYEVEHEVDDQDFSMSEYIAVNGECCYIGARPSEDGYEFFVQWEGIPEFNVKYVDEQEAHHVGGIEDMFDLYVINNEHFLKHGKNKSTF